MVYLFDKINITTGYNGFMAYETRVLFKYVYRCGNILVLGLNIPVVLLIFFREEDYMEGVHVVFLDPKKNGYGIKISFTVLLQVNKHSWLQGT